MSVLKQISACVIIFIFRCIAGAALAPVGASQQCPITVPRQGRHSAHTHLIVRRNRRGKRSDDGAREPEWYIYIYIYVGKGGVMIPPNLQFDMSWLCVC